MGKGWRTATHLPASAFFGCEGLCQNKTSLGRYIWRIYAPQTTAVSSAPGTALTRRPQHHHFSLDIEARQCRLDGAGDRDASDGDEVVPAGVPDAAEGVHLGQP